MYVTRYCHNTEHILMIAVLLVKIQNVSKNFKITLVSFHLSSHGKNSTKGDKLQIERIFNVGECITRLMPFDAKLISFVG